MTSFPDTMRENEDDDLPRVRVDITRDVIDERERIDFCRDDVRGRDRRVPGDDEGHVYRQRARAFSPTSVTSRWRRASFEPSAMNSWKSTEGTGMKRRLDRADGVAEGYARWTSCIEEGDAHGEKRRRRQGSS